MCVYVFSSCILSFFKTKALGDGGGRLDGHYFVKAPVVNEPSSCRELSDGME